MGSTDPFHVRFLRDFRQVCGAVMFSGMALAMAMTTTGTVASAEVNLVFGTYSPDKPTAMVKQLRPSLNRISEIMGEILDEEVQIRLQVVRSYEDGVSLIVDNKVDFTRLGPASYVLAKKRNPDLSILAMEKKRGNKYFHGVICVAEDSEIVNVAELQGRSFAFGNSRSTLGRYFAQQILMDHGIRADDLKRYEYLGRHDKVGQAVGSGLYDAGALEETTFNKLVKKGVKIRAIAKVRNATRPWVARAALDPRIEEALRAALLRMKDEKALAALRFEGFLPGDDTEYEATRQAIESNPGFFRQSAAQP